MPGRIAVAGICLVGASCWGFTVDDAYIVARYARHLAEGFGYVMNRGAPVTDGVTGPLWLVPGVLAGVLGLDPVVVAKALGLALTALAAAWALAATARRSLGRTGGCIAAAVLACQPTLGTWAVAGLETGAATLCAVAVWQASLGRPRPLLAGMAAGAIAWLRPDLVPFAGVLLTALLLRRPRDGRLALGIAVALGAAVCAARLGLFGDLLPLSLAAKPAQLGHGAGYVLRALLVTTAGVGLIPLAWACVDGQRRDRVLVVALATHALAMCLAGGDWMPGFRLLAPVLPAYAAVFGVGCAHALRRGRLHRWAVAMLVLGVVGLQLVDLAQRVPQARASQASRRGPGRALATALARVGGPVALVDVGHLVYAAGTAVEVVDLGGVTDPVIARQRGGHLGKRITEATLRARAPRSIVLHSSRVPVVRDGRLRRLAGYPVEQRVARMRWVRRNFVVERVVEYAPHYHYVWLTRRAPQ